MASPGVRDRSSDPPAIRFGGLNPMRNGKARHRARRRSRAGRPVHGRVRWPSRLHVHRSFLALTTRDDAIATQLTIVSVRYESAVHVVRPRRRAPARCTACPPSTIRGCTISCSIAALPRRVTGSGPGLPRRASHLSHSWNSYMSPCLSSGVKPRARSQPVRYPSAAASRRVSRIRTGLQIAALPPFAGAARPAAIEPT
jgi:hypothetical protein